MKTKLPKIFEDLDPSKESLLGDVPQSTIAKYPMQVRYYQLREMTYFILDKIRNFYQEYTDVFCNMPGFREIFNALPPEERRPIEKIHRQFNELIDASETALKEFICYYEQKLLANPSFQTEEQTAWDCLTRCYEFLVEYKASVPDLFTAAAIRRWITNHSSFFHVKIYFPVQFLVDSFKTIVTQYAVDRIFEKLSQLNALKNTDYLTMSTQAFDEVAICLTTLEENLSISAEEEMMLKKSDMYSLIETIKQKYGVETVTSIWEVRVQQEKLVMSVERLEEYYNADTKFSQLVEQGVAIGYLLEKGISVNMLLQDGVSAEQLRLAGVSDEKLLLLKKQTQELVMNKDPSLLYHHRFLFFNQPSAANDKMDPAFCVITVSTKGKPVNYLHLAHFYLICKNWKLMKVPESSRAGVPLAQNCINLILWFLLLASNEDQRRSLYVGRLGEAEPRACIKFNA